MERRGFSPRYSQDGDYLSHCMGGLGLTGILEDHTVVETTCTGSLLVKAYIVNGISIMTGTAHLKLRELWFLA